MVLAPSRVLGPFLILGPSLVLGPSIVLSTRFHNSGDVFRDGDLDPISVIRRQIWPRRHKDTERKHGAPDAAPRSGGRRAPSMFRAAVKRPLCLSVSVACPNQY